MSLVGNLEDLGLGDILQIVSLSRKSGVLHLRSGDRAGTIVFFNGQVIRATCSDDHAELGDLLVERGLVSRDVLQQALEAQRDSDTPVRLGDILTGQNHVAADVIGQVLREQIEQTVYRFFSWNEGTFAFELYEADEIAGETGQADDLFEQGINPQWLAMEGSRLLDESRHRQESVSAEELSELTGDSAARLSADESDEGVEAEPSPIEAPRGDGVPLFLVDDDALTRRMLAEALRARGFAVQAFSDGRSCLEALEKSGAGVTPPHLVVDLIMPRIDGSGILGGLELAERTLELPVGNPMVVLTDHANPDAEKMLEEKGIRHLLRKPKKDDLRSDEGRAALDALVGQIADILGKSPGNVAKSPVGLVDLGREIFSEIGEETVAAGDSRPSSPGLTLLKGMLQELNNPALGGGVILLVLRFASEIMNRAVVFLVRDDGIVGLGQFGLEQCVSDADRKVRQMRLPLDQPSVLTRALEAMTPIRTVPGDSEWDCYLQEQLGGGKPEEVFVGPILSEGRAVALLYGDNLPASEGVGDTEALEIFLSQAGLAMEKALLERRLQLQSQHDS
ncbi:MAG: response regulator [Deltaproteobacteria bacterium]|nr:MAG: response regulator [Deltaproteobacteria bacterium]